MFKRLKRLLVYNNIGERGENILSQLAFAIEEYHSGNMDGERTVEMIYPGSFMILLCERGHSPHPFSPLMPLSHYIRAGTSNPSSSVHTPKIR